MFVVNFAVERYYSRLALIFYYLLGKKSNLYRATNKLFFFIGFFSINLKMVYNTHK